VALFPRNIRLHGLIAWLSWLFIHLMYLVGFQNRLIVFIRWAFNYITYNRGARLITGELEEEPRDNGKDAKFADPVARSGVYRG
jgi:hypothetical protein